MGQVGRFLRSVAGGFAHWCPACDEMHAFAIDGPNASGARWSFNGDVEKPTFTPSMNIRTNMPDMKDYQPDACSSVCHYNLVAGMIQFGGDCTHAMKGQTVPLPELPVGHRD